MSPKSPGGFAPATKPPKYGLDEFKNFREFFDDSGLKWWIMFAGIGGLAELAHVSWEAFVYVSGRFHP
jgi:hypothetical protein